MNQIICDAIRNRHVLELNYHGHSRTVEPHAHGLSLAGNEVMRCYQTGGTSSTKVPDWKLMVVDEIRLLVDTGICFSGTRPGYAKGDKGMSKIFCEL